jgi:transposase
MGNTRKIELDGYSYLSDAQWDRISRWIPEPESQPRGGRPFHSPRDCLEGILYVLVTGCQWSKLPKCFPSPSTCWRRFDEWTRMGIFEGLWFELLNDLHEQGKIDWDEAAADAWFARAKKGATELATPSAAREPRSSTSSTRRGHHSPSTSRRPITTK